MKTALLNLLFIGIAWIVSLAFQTVIVPNVMTDHVVPPELLLKATPEQRAAIASTLKSVSSPGILEWIFAIAVVATSVGGLRASRGQQAKQ